MDRRRVTINVCDGSLGAFRLTPYALCPAAASSSLSSRELRRERGRRGRAAHTRSVQVLKRNDRSLNTDNLRLGRAVSGERDRDRGVVHCVTRIDVRLERLQEGVAVRRARARNEDVVDANAGRGASGVRNTWGHVKLGRKRVKLAERAGAAAGRGGGGGGRSYGRNRGRGRGAARDGGSLNTLRDGTDTTLGKGRWCGGCLTADLSLECLLLEGEGRGSSRAADTRAVQILEGDDTGLKTSDLRLGRRIRGERE